MSARRNYDAHLDPWCTVALADGITVLFGYALWHEGTGGLAWLSSSELIELDFSAGRAITASGRRYRLKRRFDVLDVGAEGDEARWAFDGLFGDQFVGRENLRHVDWMWLTACKVARHLAIQPPARARQALDRFLLDNEEAFLKARTAAKLHHPG